LKALAFLSLVGLVGTKGTGFKEKKEKKKKKKKEIRGGWFRRGKSIKANRNTDISPVH
jgi:hypothetical protein